MASSPLPPSNLEQLPDSRLETLAAQFEARIRAQRADLGDYEQYVMIQLERLRRTREAAPKEPTSPGRRAERPATPARRWWLRLLPHASRRHSRR